MAKKNIKDEEKEYVLIKSMIIHNQFTIGQDLSLIYFTKDELIKYIKEHGEQSIKYIFKNQPIKVETIVNINE